MFRLRNGFEFKSKIHLDSNRLVNLKKLLFKLVKLIQTKFINCRHLKFEKNTESDIKYGRIQKHRLFRCHPTLSSTKNCSFCLKNKVINRTETTTYREFYCL